MSKDTLKIPSPKIPLPASYFYSTRGGRLKVIGLSALVFAMCVFLFLFFDKDIALFIRASLTKETREAFIPITNLGKADWYIVAALGTWLLGRFMVLRAAPLRVAHAWDRLSRGGLFVIVSLAYSAVIIHILKLTVGRARPKALFREDFYGAKPLAFDTDLSSFPSGHSQTVWAVMSVLIILFPRRWPVFVSWAVLVSSSRVVVGAHFPSDIIMGSFIAVMSTLYVRHRWFNDLKAPQFGAYLVTGRTNKEQNLT
jgi:membrane-associated phospholipid phosphatase